MRIISQGYGVNKMLDCSLEYYRAFYYVALLGSVTRAAGALFLSQPAVTRTIRKLEEHLDCRLFTRDAKGSHLTREGEILYQRVEKAFQLLTEGEKELMQMAAFEMGRLDIGATETTLYHFLLPKIEAFRTLYPKIGIHVTGSSTRDTVTLLQMGEVDLSLAVSPLEDMEPMNDIAVTPVFDFQDVFVAGPFFAHLQGRVLSADELSRLPLVMVEKGTSARKNIDRWFESGGVTFEPDYSVRTTSAVVPFVLRNLAVGIMPSMFADELLGQDGFFEVDTHTSIPRREVVLMVRKTAPASQLCRVFFEFLTAQDDV